MKRPDFKEIYNNMNEYTRDEIRKILFENKYHYLDEYLLGIYLKYFLYDYEIIHNKQLKETKYRPDFLFPKLNLIVEFDGPRHYTENDIILKDIIKNKEINKLNYKIIRIPYYIQFKSLEMFALFENVEEMTNSLYKELEKYGDYMDNPNGIFSEFGNGFWSKNVILPASFCVRGVERFKEEIIFFNKNVDKFYKHFYASYAYKMQEYMSVRQVLSPLQWEEIDNIRYLIIEKEYYCLSEGLHKLKSFKDLKEDFELFVKETSKYNNKDYSFNTGKVYKNKSNGQLLLTISARSDIKEKDIVKYKKK